MIGMLVAYNDADLLSLQSQSLVLRQESLNVHIIIFVIKATTRQQRLPSSLPSPALESKVYSLHKALLAYDLSNLF